MVWSWRWKTEKNDFLLVDFRLICPNSLFFFGEQDQLSFTVINGWSPSSSSSQETIFTTISIFDQLEPKYLGLPRFWSSHVQFKIHDKAMKALFCTLIRLIYISIMTMSRFWKWSRMTNVYKISAKSLRQRLVRFWRL